MRNVRPGRCLQLAVALALLLASASGCSSSPNGDNTTVGQKLAPSLEALFEQALQRPGLSQFERDVLSRAVEAGKIAQADYEEAHSRYARCMKDAGVTETYTKLSNGLYEIHPPRVTGNGATAQEAGNRYKAVSEKCARGTMPVVESLYLVQQGNPDLLADPFAVAVRCLVKAGVAPADYTPEDLKADQKNLFAQAPYKVSDPQAHACLFAAGFAVAVRG